MPSALEAKQKEEQSVANLEVREHNKNEIFNSPFDGIVGNQNSKTTIVEFYDYNCGYCKRAQADLHVLTKVDSELHLVLKELLIPGPDSQKAHIFFMAFHKLMPEKTVSFTTSCSVAKAVPAKQA